MKKIWICPKCGSASKRNANIKRHGITVHGETVVPIGYDPLLQKLSVNEQVTYHAQEDLLPFFSHLKSKDKTMSEDIAKPLESLSNNLKMAADFADQFERLKKSSLFSGVSSSGFNHLKNFAIQNLSPVSDIVIYKPTFFTAYVCPKCATGILMPWNALTTAQAVHERSCMSKTTASNTDTAKIQSIKDSQVNQIISAMENIYPSKKYIKSFPIDEIAEIGIKLFNLVELKAVPGGHWAMRSYHDQKTEINREEMREFITIASANIAVFKAKLNTHSGYYLMYISG